MSFYTNESMLDMQQLREIMGDDTGNQPKSKKNQNKPGRRYGRFPNDGSPWGYGIGANLVNWNYDVHKGEAINPIITINDR